MVNHYTLVLSGAAQRLSDVLPLPQQGGSQEEPFQLLIDLQPAVDNEDPIYVGGQNAVVSDDDYGFAIPPPVDGVLLPPIRLGDPFRSSQVKLGHFYVIGAENEELHILVVTGV